MARQLLDASQPEACFSDGLGLRFVRTLATGETIEALRLRPELAAMRESIRDRMTRLASFRQSSFPPVRDTAAVPHQAGCLEVVSDYVPGIRLSDILEAARTQRLSISTTAALHVVRGLLGALAVLAESRDVAHGAVGPERVLLTPKGRLLVTDYVYGQALERLEYSQSKLWRVCRIPVPSGARAPSFDTRADLLQVGLMAVALLLGRPVEGDEFPGHLERLAGSLSLPFDDDRRGKVERSVKVWLGRMLETDASRPFSGARGALTALEEALASQRQAQGHASPIRLLANSYELAMAGKDGGVTLARKSEEAPVAIARRKRPTLDGAALLARESEEASVAIPQPECPTLDGGAILARESEVASVAIPQPERPTLDGGAIFARESAVASVAIPQPERPTLDGGAIPARESAVASVAIPQPERPTMDGGATLARESAVTSVAIPQPERPTLDGRAVRARESEAAPVAIPQPGRPTLDGRAIRARESKAAPGAIPQPEHPTLDGEFTREIQVESIAQPPRMFETRGAGFKSTPRRGRTVAAGDRGYSIDAERVSRPRGVVVRRVVSRGLDLATAGFLLPIRVCLWIYRAAFSVAKYAVSAVAATLSSTGSGVRAILSALFAGVRGVASGALRLGRFSGGLVTSIAGALRGVVGGAGAVVLALGRGAGAVVLALGRGAGTRVLALGRGAGPMVLALGRGAGAVVLALGRGAGAVVLTLGRGAGGVARWVLRHLDAAGGVAIGAAQFALRRTRGFAASIFPAILSAAGRGIRTVLSGTAVLGRSLGGACGRAFAMAARGTGLGAAAAAQAAGRGGGATINAMGVGRVRVIATSMWVMRATAAAIGACMAAIVRGAATLGRRVWPAGLATLSVAGRVVVGAGRAARIGASRLSPQPQLRLQILVSMLVLLVTVYGIQLVTAHWSDGVAVAGQVTHTLTSGVKRVDLREWWPAGQRRNGPKAPDGEGRLARTPVARSTDTGSVAVSSIPDGAEIWLDGELQGRAPITLDGVPAGAHTVLARSRTGEVRRAVRVQSGGTSEVAINIYSGWLVVFAPIGVEVHENGRSIGTSEAGRIRLSPGEHRLEIVSERVGFRESRTSEVKPGETVVINVQLPPALLEIFAPPDTEVLVDGLVIGTTPTEPVPVAVGTREVTLRHPTLGEQRQTATITYRTPNRVLFRSPG